MAREKGVKVDTARFDELMKRAERACPRCRQIYRLLKRAVMEWTTVLMANQDLWVRS
jgi:hypothetical protein